MNKKLLTAVVATGAIVLGGFVAAGSALAAEESVRPLMQRFAERLGVNTEEAQQAWDETHTELNGERLTNALENGTITEDQKALILEKQEEFKAALEDLRSEESVDRDAMHDLMEDTREWAEENDIPAGLVKGGGMGRGGMHGRGGMNGGGMGDGSCLK